MQNRYIVKFTNGYWKIFDTVAYTDVDICELQSQAIFRRARKNQG